MVRLPRAAQQPFHDLLRQVRRLVPRPVRRSDEGHGQRAGKEGTRLDLSEMRPTGILFDSGTFRPPSGINPHVHPLVSFYWKILLPQDVESPEKAPVEEKSPAKSEKTEKLNKSVVKSPSKSQRKVRPEEPVVIARRCVVTGCKSDARPNSVYCSDTCIVSHARESLLAMSKEKTKDAAQQEQQQPVTPTTPTGASKWKESVEFGQLMSQPTPPLPSKSKSINNQLRKSISTEYTKPANLADDTPMPVLEKSTGKGPPPKWPIWSNGSKTTPLSKSSNPTL